MTTVNPPTAEPPAPAPPAVDVQTGRGRVVEASKRVSCPRCGHKVKLEGLLAESRRTVYVHCACGGTAVVRPAGQRSAWNGQV